jgi:hypothetical protein
VWNWIKKRRESRRLATEHAQWRAELDRLGVWAVQKRVDHAGAGTLVYDFLVGPIEREFIELWLSEKEQTAARQGQVAEKGETFESVTLGHIHSHGCRDPWSAVSQIAAAISPKAKPANPVTKAAASDPMRKMESWDGPTASMWLFSCATDRLGASSGQHRRFSQNHRSGRKTQRPAACSGVDLTATKRRSSSGTKRDVLAPLTVAMRATRL